MNINPLEGGNTAPWLATSDAWSNGNKTLTFTIRQGVKWNDGKPFTAADVAFTFNLLKRFPALDSNGLWSVLSSVTAQGDTVVMDFKAPSVPYFYYIANQTPILPEHIWATVKNPVTSPVTSQAKSPATTKKDPVNPRRGPRFLGALLRCPSTLRATYILPRKCTRRPKVAASCF